MEGMSATPPDFFILKRPPTLRKWFEQRPRQAYEDFDMRTKTILFMSLLPSTIALALLSGARAALAFLLVVSICAGLLAGRGLLRDQAYRFFPAHVILYAPLWILERGLSVYWALYWRLAHGGYPFGEHLLSKGTGRAWSGARACMRKSHTLTGPLRQGLDAVHALTPTALRFEIFAWVSQEFRDSLSFLRSLPGVNKPRIYLRSLKA
jgi:hypothetical protein